MVSFSVGACQRDELSLKWGVRIEKKIEKRQRWDRQGEQF